VAEISLPPSLTHHVLNELHSSCANDICAALRTQMFTR